MHDRRGDLLAAPEPNAGDAIVRDHDALDALTHPERDAERAVRLGHGIHERVRTAQPAQTRAHRAARRAHHVVQEVVGRPSRPGSLLDVADRRGRERRLERLALEGVVQQVLDRHRHDAQELDHVVPAELADLSAERGEREDLAQR